MPTWSIEYPILLASDRAQLFDDVDLIRRDPSLGNIEVTDREDNHVMLVTASFLGLGPGDPRVAEIMRSKGTLHTPVNIWMPLIVSRLMPNSEGRYEAVRGSPPRGRTAHAIIFDDDMGFGRGPLVQPGDLVGVDPATGLIVPNSDNPIGRVTQGHRLLPV